jgi:ssDNA-specific exonuclease RecJ
MLEKDIERLKAQVLAMRHQNKAIDSFLSGDPEKEQLIDFLEGIKKRNETGIRKRTKRIEKLSGLLLVKQKNI